VVVAMVAHLDLRAEAVAVVVVLQSTMR